MSSISNLGTTHFVASSCCCLVPMGWAETRGAVVGFADTITVRPTILVAWNLLITIRIGGSAIGVDVTTTKSGVIPCVVGFLLVHGLFIFRKWPVHPESANAVEAGWGEL